ncbi:MAG TPA: hypothetical protein PLI09_06715 [Candidatus Hydrogenedentes bacterium]|nr:hypothetical protein [Candidatus Hydrogenedentota bacterium]
MQRFKDVVFCVFLAGMLALLVSPACGDSLVEVDQPVAGYEASDLLAVQNSGILEVRGWDIGFWTISDEKEIQKNLALIGHEKGAPLEKNWRVEPVAVRAASKAKTDDAEILCRQGDWIYIIGSHFGKKSGPLKASRQFFARFSESGVEIESGQCSVSVDIYKDEFFLHRLINDSLAAMRPKVIESGEAERTKFIMDAQREGMEEKEKWVHRIKNDDWPLNIEGGDFLPNGVLLLGLRYPVSREGHPLLMEIEHIDGFFSASTELPRVSKVRIIENVGKREQLTGIRSLRCHENMIHTITGSIDSRPEVSLLLQVHPEGEDADCAHYVVTLPSDGGNYIQATPVRTFEKTQNIEGIGFDADGHVFYIKDAVGQTPLIFPRE